MLKTVLISLAFLGLVGVEQGTAAGRLKFQAQTFEAAQPDIFDVAQEEGGFPIKPSEAAMIAKNAYPDGKVLNVKLLPSGDYAVTLRVGGSVQRVLVNATSGEVS